MANYSGIVFDFDGTLTQPHAIDFSGIKAAIGCDPDGFILEHIETLPVEERPRAHQIVREFELDSAHTSRPQPGVEAVLRELSLAGIPYSILTRNCRPAIDISLGYFDGVVATDFSRIVTRDDDIADKPAPVGVLLACEAMGCRAHEAVMVGDYRFDIQAGQAAGAKTVLFGPESPLGWDVTPDHQVLTMAELRDILLG